MDSCLLIMVLLYPFTLVSTEDPPAICTTKPNTPCCTFHVHGDERWWIMPQCDEDGFFIPGLQARFQTEEGIVYECRTTDGRNYRGTYQGRSLYAGPEGFSCDPKVAGELWSDEEPVKEPECQEGDERAYYVTWPRRNDWDSIEMQCMLSQFINDIGWYRRYASSFDISILRYIGKWRYFAISRFRYVKIWRSEISKSKSIYSIHMWGFFGATKSI